MKSQSNQRPPEPKVAGSNLAWRARNSRENQSRECTGQHENTRRRGAVLTNKRQSGEDTGEQPVASGVDSIRAAAGDVTASDLAEVLRSVLTDMVLLGAEGGTPLPKSYGDAEDLLARFRAQVRTDWEQSGQAAVSEAPLPEALRGCADFARGFIEGTRATPNHEQDRAIILRALDVLQVWDELGVSARKSFFSSIESLRDALVAAGYLDAKGGANG